MKVKRNQPCVAVREELSLVVHSESLALADVSFHRPGHTTPARAAPSRTKRG